MKFKNMLLVLLINISGFSLIKSQPQCYCAVKCGPRNLELNKLPPDKPRPFKLHDGRQICLCADRDERILIETPHKCDRKLNKHPEDIVKTNGACSLNLGASKRKIGYY